MNTRAVLLTLFLVGSVLWAQDTKAPDAATQHAKVPASSQQGNTPVAAASSGTVPVGREGHHHQLLDNQYVRAYYVEIAPHQSTLMHHHGIDYLAYSIGHSVISVTSGDGKATNVVLENGELRYTPSGVVHTVTNLSDAPFRQWDIELLQNQGHPVCMNHCESDPRAGDWPPLTGKSKLIGYGDGFRITQTTIEPKQVVSTEAPFSHLVIMITDLQGHVAKAGDSSNGGDFTQKAGDLMFHGPHGDNALTNMGDHDARSIMVEFKPLSSGAVKP